MEGLIPGQPLSYFIDAASRTKLFNFLLELHNNGAAFNWEINLCKGNQVILLRLAGVIEKSSLMIVFSQTPLDTLYILNGLVKISRNQAAILQNAVADHMQPIRSLSDADLSVYDEITRINNELATLQRDLIKKNGEHERLNTEILKLNQQLDQRLKERNGQLVLTNQLLVEKVAQLEQAQQSRRELFIKYSVVADNTYDWEYWLDTDGQFLYSSPSCKRLTGYESAEFMDHPLLLQQIIHTDDLLDWQKHRAQELLEKVEGQIEFRIQCSDGSMKWIGHVCQPVYDEQQVFLGSRGSNRDITERKLAEDSLHQSNENANAILNAATETVFLMNVDGKIILTNATAAQRLGKSVNELLGANIFELLPAEVVESRKGQLEGVVRNGAPICFEDQRLDTWFENNIYPIVEANGKINRVAVFGRDITERKRAEENKQKVQIELQSLLAETEKSRRALLSVVEDQKEAEEQTRLLNKELEQRVVDRTERLTAANQEMEAFSYSVSHDLRAPLRTMDGFSAIMMENYGGQLDEQGRLYLTRIQEASRHMGKLINNLLDLSRISRAEFNSQQVNLSAMAHEIASELQENDPGRKVEFVIADNLTTTGDANLIRIALNNLFDNAYKFTRKKEIANISLGTCEREGESVYFVSDNGAGFEMEYAVKLFTPFQRLHSAKEYPGTGIGLSIVKRIIARHGGRIWPESKTGEGTVFFFTLGKMTG